MKSACRVSRCRDEQIGRRSATVSFVRSVGVSPCLTPTESPSSRHHHCIRARGYPGSATGGGLCREP